MTTKRVPLTHEWTQTGSSSGLLSARPSASTAGAGYVYTATDTGISYVSSGSDWFQAEITATGGPPSGTAGGDLTGSYPNPTIAAGAVTDTKVAAANKDGASGTASMRTLGTGASQATAGNDSRLSDSRTPTAHATSHKSGGSDAIKIDEFAAPTDITTLNVSTSAHGLTPKLPNDATKFLDGTGAYTVPGGGTGSVASDAIWDAKGDLAVGTGADTASKLTVGSDGKVLTADSSQSTGTKWATPGTGTVAKLYDYEVSGSDKASIDSNVDGTTVANFSGYDVLEVWLIARTDDAGADVTVSLIVNNDTGTNYDEQILSGINATAAAGVRNAGTAWQDIHAHGSGGSSGYPGVTRLTIPGYASTTFWKVAEVLGAIPDATAGNQDVRAYAVGWRSTAAITRLKLAANGTAKLKVGSRLIVYGR